MRPLVMGVMSVVFLGIGIVASLWRQCIIPLFVFGSMALPFLALSVLDLLFDKRLSGAVPGSFVAGTMICETEEEY